MLSPNFLKLHEFQNPTCPKIKANISKSRLNYIGKIISTERVSKNEFCASVALLCGKVLDVYKMRFDIEEGNRGFSLQARIDLRYLPAQMVVLSQRHIALFSGQIHNHLEIIDVFKSESINIKRLKGTHS